MKRELISIIVPVYNVEDYIDTTINSIINQTYRDLEIILVDDGSSDNSGKICDAQAKNDSRIRVIHQQNGGVSSARNTGLDAANGKYIGFVDGDDLIDPRMYEKLFLLLTRYKCDIACCSVMEDNTEYKNFKSVMVLERHDAMRALVMSNGITVSAPDKLYKKTIWDGIRFDEEMSYGEDLALMHLLIDKADRVACTPERLYHYVMRDDSVTHSFSNKNFQAAVAWRRRADFIAEYYHELESFVAEKYIEFVFYLLWWSDSVMYGQFKNEREQCRRDALLFLKKHRGIITSLKIKRRVFVLYLGLKIYDVTMTIYGKINKAKARLLR